jgi:hypothetical protein
MEGQCRYHILERLEALRMRGDRHDDVDASTDASQKQDAADDI